MKIIRHLLVVVALTAASRASSTAESTPPTTPKPPPRMEVAFVLDTTGSMGGMIAGAKQKIWAIANQLKSAEPTPEIRFGLVAFRDRGDAYVTQVHDLNPDLDAVYQKLHACRADGGGDGPESVNEALHLAVDQLAWSDDPQVLRVIFLVGDAPPHMDYKDDVKYVASCRAAKRRGVLINALQCGSDPDTKTVWQDIARRSGGTYAAILQDGGSVKIETPYDAEIVRLNEALDATIVPYGKPEERQNATRNRALLTSMSREGIADRSSFLRKTEFGAVISGKGDLVLEVMSDRMQLSSIDPEKLDPSLRLMFAEERNALILRKVEERRALQEELVAVLAQRDAVVAEKLASLSTRDDVLELSAFEVLTKQAVEKGYEFKK